MANKKNYRSKVNWAAMATKIACTLAGVAAGSYASGLIGKKDEVSGTDLLGLDGDTSNYVAPLVTAAAGGVLYASTRDENIRNVAVGIMAAGGAKVVNKLAGKSLVSLNGTDEEQPVIVPGIGDVYELPTENQWATTYNDPTIIPGAQNADMTTEPINGILL